MRQKLSRTVREECIRMKRFSLFVGHALNSIETKCLVYDGMEHYIQRILL